MAQVSIDGQSMKDCDEVLDGIVHCPAYRKFRSYPDSRVVQRLPLNHLPTVSSVHSPRVGIDRL